MTADDLFGAHLDLRLLGRRRHGLVRCCFHGDDSTPSLSVDLDHGLFHCFGCGAQGGTRVFRRLLGLPPDLDDVTPHAPPHSPPTTFDRARAMALRQPWAAPGVVESYRRADEARALHREADEFRHHAAHNPLAEEDRWELLADAAWRDTEAERIGGFLP